MSGEDAHVHAPKTKDEGFGLARFGETSDQKMRQKTPEGMARRSDPILRTVASAMTRSGMERIRIPGARAGKEGRNARAGEVGNDKEERSADPKRERERPRTGRGLRYAGTRGPGKREGPAHGGAFGAPGRMRGRAGRARRPCLPRAFPAVRRAMAGLTAGFGTGPGDPRLRGRARPGRPCGRP